MLDFLFQENVANAFSGLLLWLWAATVLHRIAMTLLIVSSVGTIAVLVYLIVRCPGLGLRSVAVSVLLFICGMVAWALTPASGQGGIRLALELVMAGTTTALLLGLLRVTPSLLRLPTPAEFHRANEALGAATVGRQIAQAELRRSEQRFQSAFLCSAVSMLITDAQGRILRYNEAICELLGRPGQRPSPASRFVHADDHAFLSEALRLSGPQTPARDEIRLIGRGGRVVWVAATIAQMNGSETGPPEFVWQLQDVTERKAYERGLREARDRFEQLVAERTEELAAANRRLAQANSRLSRMASRDELTGVGNRRHLDQALRHAVDSARRYGHCVSLLMIDIDHFKEVNDRYGHQAGDRALAATARVVRDNCRSTDALGRYGGDELCLILPHTDGEQMTATAHKIHERVSEMLFADEHGRRFSITCSIGAATWGETMRDEQALLRRADEALYSAKTQGRDRVVVATPQPTAVVHKLNV